MAHNTAKANRLTLRLAPHHMARNMAKANRLALKLAPQHMARNMANANRLAPLLDFRRPTARPWPACWPSGKSSSRPTTQPRCTDWPSGFHTTSPRSSNMAKANRVALRLACWLTITQGRLVPQLGQGQQIKVCLTITFLMTPQEARLNRVAPQINP